ncbi:MAG: DUF1697 domain-containing protein [Acidimicrobiales bacterium]|nr:DUF1697 domain-containing protein [Acidimicrobiales bacterium]
MRTFSFLRGINVGNRRPKKDDLIAAVTGPQLDDVSTYQASGNLAFETDADPADLETVLERRLEAALGYEVTCFVRTLDELVEVADALPALGPDEKHQIIFYRSDPGDDARTALAATAGPNDTLRPRRRETIWTHTGGMLDSPLQVMSPPTGWPVTTVRTAGTVERLVAKFVD